MEILFVHIEKNNVLKGRQFNLSSKFNIHYDVDKNTLEINDSDFTLISLFPNNILDIKAVLGANGSGKSSLLRYLFRNGHESVEYWGQDYPNDIIVYLFKDKLFVASSSDNGKSPITFLNNSKLDQPTRVRFSGDFQWNKLPSFNDLGFVYFSNVFDSNYLDDFEGKTRSSNISTNYLLKNDINTIQPGQRKGSGLQQTDYFNINEIKRQLSFIHSNKTTKLGFKLPKKLEFILFDFDLIYLRSYSNEKLPNEVDNTKDVKDLIIVLEKYNSTSHSVKVFKNHLRSIEVKVLYNFVRHLLEGIEIEVKIGSSVRSEVMKSIIQNTSTKKVDFNSIITDVKTTINRYDKDNSNDLKVLLSNLKSYIHFIKVYHNLFDLELEDDFPFSVYTDNKGIKEWLDAYLNCKKGIDFIGFQWTSLSTGELARLNFLSRVNSVFSNHKVATLPNIILLIDEADVFLHPNWQREFISWIVNDLSTLFKSKKVQVIFTTHSPFVTSDLTKAHVLFLDEEGIESSNHEETFAQNIFTLFKDSFYLKSPVGKFATNKINSVVEFLTEGTKGVEKWDQTSAKKFINIIGEPLIKDELLGLYYEKFYQDGDIIDKEIALLQKLKNKKDDRDKQ